MYVVTWSKNGIISEIFSHHTNWKACLMHIHHTYIRSTVGQSIGLYLSSVDLLISLYKLYQIFLHSISSDSLRSPCNEWSIRWVVVSRQVTAHSITFPQPVMMNAPSWCSPSNLYMAVVPQVGWDLLVLPPAPTLHSSLLLHICSGVIVL